MLPHIKAADADEIIIARMGAHLQQDETEQYASHPPDD
jgi:hypothetical protein